MQIVGITEKCKNDCIREALMRSGYRLLPKRASWPRAKRSVATRLEVLPVPMSLWQRRLEEVTKRASS
jgi:hypothetical protein